MRCTSWQVFQKAIQQRGDVPLSYYLFSVKERDDISFVQSYIESCIFSCKRSFVLHHCDSVDELLLRSSHPSLFGNREVFIFEGENVPTKRAPKNSIFVFITASKNCQALEALYPEEAIWLDLSLEKPWERQARLSQEMQRLLVESKKAFAPGVVKLFTERFAHLPFVFWVNELEKLLLYAMDLPTITERIAGEVLSEKVYPEGGEFQDIEKLLQGNVREFPLGILDVNTLFVFINKARAMLEKTLWILGWLSQGLSEKEMGKITTSISPYFIKKVTKNRSAWNLKKLQGVVVSVYFLEIKAKKRQATPSVLFSAFLGEIHCIYNAGALRKGA